MSQPAAPRDPVTLVSDRRRRGGLIAGGGDVRSVLAPARPRPSPAPISFVSVGRDSGTTFELEVRSAVFPPSMRSRGAGVPTAETRALTLEADQWQTDRGAGITLPLGISPHLTQY